MISNKKLSPVSRPAYHDLATFIYIYSLCSRLALKASPVQTVPAVVTHVPHSDNFSYARCLAVLVEPQEFLSVQTKGTKIEIELCARVNVVCGTYAVVNPVPVSFAT